MGGRSVLTSMDAGWILFFDGECGFCSAAVRWVARRDKRGRISFAPLQGRLAGELGLSRHAAPEGGTLVLMREPDGKVWTRSDACLELAWVLGGGWRVLLVLKGIPRCIRDAAYRWVADHRQRWFKVESACGMPDKELRKRMRE